MPGNYRLQLRTLTCISCALSVIAALAVSLKAWVWRRYNTIADAINPLAPTRTSNHLIATPSRVPLLHICTLCTTTLCVCVSWHASLSLWKDTESRGQSDEWQCCHQPGPAAFSLQQELLVWQERNASLREMVLSGDTRCSQVTCVQSLFARDNHGFVPPPCRPKFTYR